MGMIAQRYFWDLRQHREQEEIRKTKQEFMA